MNRVVASIVWAAMAMGCQTEDPFSTEQQALSCKPEAPYCDAKMPPVLKWQKGDKAPKVSANSYALLIDLGNGQMLATLSDFDQGKVVWARTIDKKETGVFIDTSGLDVMIDIRRPPPRPPVGPGGNDWNAYFSLELGSRSLPLANEVSDVLDNHY